MSWNYSVNGAYRGQKLRAQTCSCSLTSFFTRCLTVCLRSSAKTQNFTQRGWGASVCIRFPTHVLPVMHRGAVLLCNPGGCTLTLGDFRDGVTLTSWSSSITGDNSPDNGDLKTTNLLLWFQRSGCAESVRCLQLTTKSIDSFWLGHSILVKSMLKELAF